MRPIYLDYNATTPLDNSVLESMIQYMTYENEFGNASSKHSYGVYTSNVVEECRNNIQICLGDTKLSGRLIFTSGATESNNLIIQSFAQGYGSFANKKQIYFITSKIEHKCILSSMKSIGHLHQTDLLDVDSLGYVDLDKLERFLIIAQHSNEIPFVSIMAVNNEVGTVQNLKKISELVHKYKGIFHVDAAQAIGKIDFNVNELGVDAVSLSAHKFYGPKGVGALWLKNPNLITKPILFGGGQEFGLRSGTLNVPGIVGMSHAIKLNTKNTNIVIRKLQHQLWSLLSKNLEEVSLNGPSVDNRQLGNLNVSFKFVPSNQLVAKLFDKVSISVGSACTSTSVEPSHVLKAMRISDEDINSSVRICIGKYTTWENVINSAQFIIQAVKEIRIESEMWKIFKTFQNV